jgi:hypothetical protein
MTFNLTVLFKTGSSTMEMAPYLPFGPIASPMISLLPTEAQVTTSMMAVPGEQFLLQELNQKRPGGLALPQLLAVPKFFFVTISRKAD